VKGDGSVEQLEKGVKTVSVGGLGVGGFGVGGFHDDSPKITESSISPALASENQFG
jgi:hypothetical protein